MHEVRTKFLYQVQGQADFQHCEVLEVVKLTVMTICDDRRLSIEILGAVGMPSIRITGLTLCLLYGSLCLVGLNLVLGKVAYWVLSSRTGQNSRTGKVRVSVGTYVCATVLWILCRQLWYLRRDYDAQTKIERSRKFWL